MDGLRRCDIEQNDTRHNDILGQCHKTLYVRNLRVFVIRKSVCHWQIFTSLSNVCGQGHERTLEWKTREVLHSGRLRPFFQTLDKGGEAWQERTL
jgi:hypothetical protein